MLKKNPAWWPTASTAHKWKLKRERRNHLITIVCDFMRPGEPTLFAREGRARAGLRSQLCLQKWPWGQADLTAADVIAGALRRLGARRPRWVEGQREYVNEGVTLLEHIACIQCGKRLPENHVKFCSKRCAGIHWHANLDAERREAERQRKIAIALAYRREVEAKTCEGCGRRYQPGKASQRFCSRTCSGGRSVAEKMNGKRHPWKIGDSGANGAGHSSQESNETSVRGDARPPTTPPSTPPPAPRSATPS